MASTSKLSILIDAKNNASGPIKQVEGQISGLDKAAGSIGGGLAGLAGAAGIAGIVGLGTAAASATMEMARASAETERLGTAFDTLAGQAGQSGDTMLSAMQAASQGTISNAELMASANRAMLLGVADSAEEMAQLLDVASARGKAMGESTAQAFSDLVTGIGRMSPMILDNLGITIDAAKANDVYAESVGKTAGQLTDAEKKQALLNAVVQSSTDLINANKAAGLDAAANFERMDAAIQNAKDALGTLFEPAMVVVAQAIADAATSAAQAMQDLAPEAIATRQSLAVLDQGTIGLENDIGQLEQGLRRLKAAGQENTAVYQENAAKLAQLKAQLQETKSAHDALIPSIQLANQDFQQLSMSADEARQAIAAAGGAAVETGSKLRAMGADALAAMEQFNQLLSVNAQIASAASQSGTLFGAKQGGDAGLSRQKAVNAELQAQNQTWLDMHYTQKQIDDVLMPAYIKNLQDADQATFKVATGTAKISDEARAAQKAFDDLTNTVAGVLQGALDPGVGVNPDDLLPRQDAINENARRLADVAVKGWDSPWAEYFRTTFPDLFQEMAASNDIKTGAAIMLRNFQDGLEPELIDKDKAKERVRKMLIGDANMAELATEIATELSQEMGIPMQQALAAAQGTLGGGTGTGTVTGQAIGDSMAQAITDADTGGTMVSQIDSQMRARYSLFGPSGAAAAKVWGEAFLAKVGDSVPAELINILTTLITPQVIAQLGQRGTLTGATP